MKTLNTNIVKIKDENNNWSSIPALRGESAYELAVKKGFEGSEDDFNNSLVKKEEIDKISETLKGKLNVPLNPLVGKYLRVKAVNEDGVPELEWVDEPSGGSNLDIQIDGESIVQDGVAEIPVANNYNTKGLVKIGGIYDGLVINDNGVLMVNSYSQSLINGRKQNVPICAKYLDDSVKAAMCDGKGDAWTAEEQVAARARMGAWSGDWQIIMDETLAELTQEVSFEVPDDTKEMICFFKSGATVAETTVYLRTENSGASVGESFSAFGGLLETNAISIGCQKIQFISSQYGLIEYSYLSHLEPSSTDNAQRAGKTSPLRIDDKRFFFHSVNRGTGYPAGTRLLVLARR